MFIVLVTMQKRRLQQQQQRRPQGGGGNRGFGYDGVRLHGGGGGGKRREVRWIRRRIGPAAPGGRKGAGPKQVAIELARAGFDHDSDEEMFAGLKLEQGDREGSKVGEGGAGGGGGAPTQAVVGVRVPTEGHVRHSSMQSVNGREARRMGDLLDVGVAGRESEHEALLGGELDRNFEGGR